MKKVRKWKNPWTHAELVRLARLASAKVRGRRYSARMAATILGRTVGAVKWQAMQEGIHFRNIAQKPGTQRTPKQRERLRQVQLRRWARARRAAR